MRFNQITPASIRKVPDSELLNLHFRAHQLAAPYFRKNDVSNPKLKNLIIRHKIIATEMVRRGIRFRVHDELDRVSYPEIEQFVERFAKIIPSRLSDLSKSELVKLHNQLHSVWEVIHLKDVTITQQEQLWNWHHLVEKELMRRGLEVPQNWDSLDRPLGRAMRSPGFASSGEEMGPWIFVEDIVSYIPKEVVVVEQAVLIDVNRGHIWLTDIGGRQLIKVMYFRILRQFPREEWNKYKPVSMEQLEGVDVAYDLVLKKLDPLWTVQLNYQFDDLCLVKPYLYFVGGIATRGATKNDVDVLLRAGLSVELEEKIYSAFIARFPDSVRYRFSKVEDSGLSPFTSYIGVCSLDLVRSFNTDLIQHDPDDVLDEHDEELDEGEMNEE